jgi:DNA-binding CsgD family transcriptional regulator
VTPEERIAQACSAGWPDRQLREAVLEALRPTVPFDAHVWLLADPETGVGWSPLATVPPTLDLPALIRARYRSRDEWLDLLRRHGIDDVLTTELADGFGGWGFVDLWRAGATFTEEERRRVGALLAPVVAALRASLVPAFETSPLPASGPGPAVEAGPAVVLVGNDLALGPATPATEAHLRALLPTDEARAPVPAAVYNVAARLLASEADDATSAAPASARVHTGGGRWLALRAARLDDATIAVTLEPTSAAERADLYARVAGLSRREAELLGHLVDGCDTRELARRLVVSEHTVQDHLKAIFAKTGTRGRRRLVANATGP